MNILDENIPEVEREQLTRWRIRVRHIGHGFSRPGIQDDEIIPFLLTLPRPTFFTRDSDFYDRNLCHERYGVAVLNVSDFEAAIFIRRFLRHPAFNTQAKRMGKVALVGHSAIRFWRLHAHEEELSWLP